MIRIATWNINSVRLRIDLVVKLLEEAAPDVLCLQETKTVDDAFPAKALAAAGYRHLHCHGQKSWNGVALVSRLPLRNLREHHRCGRQDCRHVSAELPGGIELHCVYIPAGGDIPDPVLNDKFAHKLRFLEELTEWWPTAAAAGRPVIMAGDFNVAPHPNDVWSHSQLLDVVSHTPVEVEKLAALQASLDWVDTARALTPAEQKLYTWWSYRARDWEASDRGRRLDHIWCTPALAGNLRRCTSLRAARGWQPKPSDHVPVLAEFAL
jgi:exodeoxyribonuclease-3